jgi:hypothetical protein
MAERSCYVYIARGERSGQDLVESLSAVWTAVLYPSTARSLTRGREHRRAPGAPVSA